MVVHNDRRFHLFSLVLFTAQIPRVQFCPMNRRLGKIKWQRISVGIHLSVNIRAFSRHSSVIGALFTIPFYTPVFSFGIGRINTLKVASTAMNDLIGKIVVIKRNGADGPQFPLRTNECLFGR